MGTDTINIEGIQLFLLPFFSSGKIVIIQPLRHEVTKVKLMDKTHTRLPYVGQGLSESDGGQVYTLCLGAFVAT
jgi:hypothetical protein